MQRDGQLSQDQGTVKTEPGQQEPAVVAGRGKDDVDRIAASTREVVALHKAVALQVTMTGSMGFLRPISPRIALA